MFLFSLWEEHPVILFHFLMVGTSVVLGALQLALAKGTRKHRILGRIWVGLMMGACFSSFLINSTLMHSLSDMNRFLGFSLIHLLSLWTIIALILAVRAAKQGNIKKHKTLMWNIYIFGLGIPGIFALLPGRILYKLLF